MHVALVMDTSFEEALSLHGLNSESISILEEEGIINIKITKTLKKEHLTQLLQVLIIGQHALLLDFLADRSTAVGQY